jgi:hypothetical protein
MATSEAQKQAVIRYRQKHREEAKLCTKKFRENNPTYNKVFCQINIDSQRDYYRLYKFKVDSFKREWTRFLKIDLF